MKRSYFVTFDNLMPIASTSENNIQQQLPQPIWFTLVTLLFWARVQLSKDYLWYEKGA